MRTTNPTALTDGDAAGDSADVPEVTDAVAAAARGLRYGSIEVVVHEGRVVQVIRTEKRRFTR